MRVMVCSAGEGVEPGLFGAGDTDTGVKFSLFDKFAVYTYLSAHPFG